MATVTAVSTDSRNIVLHDIPWHLYRELRDNPANYHLRMTYDQGTLEFMAPSFAHGRYGSLIAMAILAWCEELDIPIVCLGDLTCEREDVEKGFEPDNCFYIQHEPQIWQKMEVDLSIDPPPDLAIEIEISRSAIQKIESIYSAFGVPEVWRFDGSRLRAYELVDGEYRSCQTSHCLPRLPLEKVEELVRQVGQVRDLTLIGGFRHRVRETFAAGGRD